MVGTIFSILVAIYLFFNPLPENVADHAGTFSAILFLIGTLTLLTALAITLFAWSPLQQAEQTTTPGVIKIFTEDRQLKLTSSLIIAFLILSYVFAIDLLFLQNLNPTYLLMAWTIVLGVTVDVTRHLLHRVMNFLDPQHVIEYFGTKAEESVRKSDFQEVCNWYDRFSEIGMKALAKHNNSLCLTSIDKMRSLTKSYLAQAMNIHFNDEEEKGDHVNYTLFYLFQRIEMIYESALRLKLEPVCSYIITMLGKVAIYCAEFDISVAHYPLHYLGKLTNAAQKNNLEEVGNRASLTMLEISKIILEEVDLQYVDIKETFLTVVNNMHEIARESFRNDKSTNISLLTQPLYLLKELFQKGKAASHQDAPVIIANIDQVLNEFATLETVLNTMPPMPEMEKEKQEMEQVVEETEEEPENEESDG